MGQTCGSWPANVRANASEPTWSGVYRSHDKNVKLIIRNRYNKKIIHTADVSVDKFGYGKYQWDISRFSKEEISGEYEVLSTYNYNMIVETSPTGEDSFDAQSITSNVRPFNIRTLFTKQGCTDPNSINFDIYAEEDDGTCKYQYDCIEKYQTESITRRTVDVDSGYNTISYPYDFSTISGLNFFEVLDSSYYGIGEDGNIDTEPGKFSDSDTIISLYKDDIYSATYVIEQGEETGYWQSIDSKGRRLETVNPGMGFILVLKRPGKIDWAADLTVT